MIWPVVSNQFKITQFLALMKGQTKPAALKHQCAGIGSECRAAIMKLCHLDATEV